MADMEIWDKYFYGEEIPRLLSEITGTFSRMAFWANETKTATPAKLEGWNKISAKYRQSQWPEERYMNSQKQANEIYSHLKQVLSALEKEEEAITTNRTIEGLDFIKLHPALKPGDLVDTGVLKDAFLFVQI